MHVCVYLSECCCFFRLLYLRLLFWIFPLFRLYRMLPPYMVCNRLLVGRSNIEFHIKGELCFDQIISFLYILRCSIQAIQFSFENPLKQNKTSTQNVQIGEYSCKVFVQTQNNITKKNCSLQTEPIFSHSFLFVEWIFAILVRNCLCFGHRQCCTRSDCITCSSSGCPSSCGCTHRACCPSCC